MVTTTTTTTTTMLVVVVVGQGNIDDDDGDGGGGGGRDGGGRDPSVRRAREGGRRVAKRWRVGWQDAGRLVTVVLRGVEGVVETEGRRRQTRRTGGRARRWRRVVWVVGWWCIARTPRGEVTWLVPPAYHWSLPGETSDTLCPPSIVPCTLPAFLPAHLRRRGCGGGIPAVPSGAPSGYLAALRDLTLCPSFVPRGLGNAAPFSSSPLRTLANLSLQKGDDSPFLWSARSTTF